MASAAGTAARANTVRTSAPAPWSRANAASGPRTGAEVVGGAMEAERPAAPARRRGGGEQRVAGRRADPLPHPVHEAHGEHLARRPGQRDERPRHRREAVSRHDERLRRGTRSDHQPLASLSNAAVVSAAPSIAPSVAAPAPRVAVRKTGSSG
jgi:hypothetical protein